MTEDRYKLFNLLPMDKQLDHIARALTHVSLKLKLKDRAAIDNVELKDHFEFYGPWLVTILRSRMGLEEE